MWRSQLKKLFFKEALPMNDYPKYLKEKLTLLIRSIDNKSDEFVKNPGKDFIRNRKLPFETIMQLLISMGGNSIYTEMLEAHGYNTDTVTSSAFVQQRSKILPYAFEFLFREFTKGYTATKTFRGYRLLATDGSSVRIATNPDDPDTFIPKCENGYNLLHMNAMYDLCNRLYVDTVVQSVSEENERRALVEMVERSYIKDKVLIVADRGYESYNTFAHLERKGWKYLIRVKEPDSSGILSRISLPSEAEFDVCVQRILTKKNTKEIRELPNVYHSISPDAKFDFLDKKENLFYSMTFRVVRFKISDNNYETVITNTDQSDFSPEELKMIYNMRWGIETSFRELKYAVGLVNFHAKKRECIVQEIFARLIMHNFAEMIISNIIISQKDTKHIYQVNFTTAIRICKRFLQTLITLNNASPPNVEALIRKNILPVRPGRKDKRKLRPQKAVVSFIYRVA